MQRTEPEIWLLIPAFDAGGYLDRLLSQVLEVVPADRVLVVDDGSKDMTAAIARAEGVNLLRHENNLGKGAALCSGFSYLYDQDAEWVITLDADLQHDPTRLPEFIKSAKTDKYDFVIGERRRDQGGMPLDRRFSNWMTSRILSFITGEEIRDSQNGYRLIRCRMLKELELISTGYELETELLLKLIQAGARMSWIEIPTWYRGAPSSINRVRDTLKFLKVVIKFVFSNSAK